MKFNLKRILLNSGISIVALSGLLCVFYLLVLPKSINSNYAISFAQKTVKEFLNCDLEISNIKLKTFMKPQIELRIDKLNLSRNNDRIILLENFEIELGFNKIFKKELDINELNANRILIDLDKLISNLPKEEKSSKNAGFKIDVLSADANINNLSLRYLINGALIDLYLNNVKFHNQDLLFESTAKVSKNNKDILQIEINSKNEIKLSQGDVIVDNLDILINDSKLNIDLKIDSNCKKIRVKSEKFYLADIFDLINSGLIVADGEKLLSPLKNPKGNIKFDVASNDAELTGIVDVSKTGIEIKDFSSLPVYISKGLIKITKDKILFNNLNGHYGKNLSNQIHITGDIKDYYNSFDSNIIIESKLTNEFFNDYLCSMVNNTQLYVSAPSKVKVIYKSKNSIMDIILFAQINKGVDFGVTTEKSALSDYDRAILGEFQIHDNKLNIKNINYYVASNIVRGVKLAPIIQINGLMNLDGTIDKIGFSFARELPSEFLNIFFGQKMFKKGTIKGKLCVEFQNRIPHLNADMEVKKVLIPSQRIYLKDMSLKTTNDAININTQGKFKRANFDFRGNIKNSLVQPYIVRNLSLELDNVDIEKWLESFNNQNSPEVVNNTSSDEVVDDNYMFNTNLIRIENCDFKLASGNYKELTFGNISAKLTLDENGILKIKSNKFNIANGTSSLKVECDLNKLKYYIKLGVKEIDSNLMAKSLFNLDKEINGLADGMIELYGDKTLKMNGNIQFTINDGSIGKVGLVEYLMKIASVFRNPIAMVSPVTIMDIISIPEGKFDKIVGNIKIKDNVLAPIDIKSYSKTLSALIKGKFDLERHDASIRIYTRFSTDKNFAFGFLRNISLNSLANKVKLGSNNDSNYYESELQQLPPIEGKNDKSQVFLTQVEGDIEHYNFLSSLKKIK